MPSNTILGRSLPDTASPRPLTASASVPTAVNVSAEPSLTKSTAGRLSCETIQPKGYGGA